MTEIERVGGASITRVFVGGVPVILARIQM